jgi:hypothetical protein
VRCRSTCATPRGSCRAVRGLTGGRRRIIRADDSGVTFGRHARAIDLLFRRILVVAAFPAAVLAVAACGGDSRRVSSPARPAAATRVLSSPALFSVERRHGDAAIGETLTVGSDGSAVIVRAAGGGGRLTERCRLGASLVARLRREAPQLPAPSPSRMRSVANPSIYLLSRDGRHAVFMDGAIPRSVRPFVAHVKGVLAGRWGRCAPSAH